MSCILKLLKSEITFVMDARIPLWLWRIQYISARLYCSGSWKYLEMYHVLWRYFQYFTKKQQHFVQFYLEEKITFKMFTKTSICYEVAIVQRAVRHRLFNVLVDCENCFVHFSYLFLKGKHSFAYSSPLRQSWWRQWLLVLFFR
jgi:hypothetical protein